MRPEAIGRSSTATMGTGTFLYARGKACRVANLSDIQEVVAPESIRAYVFMGLNLGIRSVTERRRCWKVSGFCVIWVEKI